MLTFNQKTIEKLLHFSLYASETAELHNSNNHANEHIIDLVEENTHLHLQIICKLILLFSSRLRDL